MAIPGELSVAVHDSHPVLGEQYEFAFYLEPPYSKEAVSKKRDEMAKRWIEVHASHGRKLTSKIVTFGPHGFMDDERRIHDMKWFGQDEYVLRAWFKHERPRILRASAIDQWIEARKKFGYEYHEPTSSKHDPRATSPLGLENDWLDK